jgi:PilZ domain
MKFRPEFVWIMGKRREPRKPVELTVRILGTDARGQPFAEKVDAVDASRCGLHVRGLSVTLKLEDIVSVSYKDQKARYRVKWIGETTIPAGGRVHWEAGLENIAPERNIFDFPLPNPVLDHYAGPSSGERRSFPRMRCVASAELQPDGQAAPIMVGITDLSLGGCFIDMPMPLQKGTHLKVRLWLNTIKVQANAVVSNSRPGFGMGLEFTGVPAEEQTKLREYIAKIPRYPFQQPR